MKKFNRFDLASFGLLTFITLFSLARYSYLPQFIDGYYHLSVANGFIQSGGWVGWDWWSFAPLGRPHLYAPFYHLILAFLHKIGIGGLTSIRIAETAITPLFFFTLWFVFRKLVNSKFSFINLFVLSSFFSFYSSVSAHVPASLSLIFGFFSWYFLKRKKSLSAALCLTFAFYSHFGLFWVFFISLLCVFFFNKEYRNTALKSLGIAFLLALPLLFHFLSHWGQFNIQAFDSSLRIHFSLLILALGIYYLGLSLFKKNLTNLLFLGYFLGSLLIFTRYPYRLFSAQGAIGLALFCSLFLEKIIFSFQAKTRNTILCCIAAFFLIFHPSLDSDNGQIKLNPLNSSYYNLLSGRFDEFTEFRSIFYPQYYDPIIKAIKENTDINDIIYSNLTVTSQIFSSLSQRPSSKSMLWEVMPLKDFEPYQQAKIIVWMKPLTKEAISQKKDIAWELIHENEMAYVFENLKYEPRLEKVESKIGFKPIKLIAFFLIFILIADNTLDGILKKIKKEKSKPTP